MTAFPHGADAADGFLQMVARDRDARCARILGEAEAQARVLLGEARRQARARMGAAVRDERERCRREVEAAAADLATRERTLTQDVAHALLARGWDQVSAALQERWSAPESRARWIRALIKRAAAVLPAGAWRLEYPASLDDTEVAELIAGLRAASGAAPQVVAVDELRAGLRIAREGAVVDGTPAGLLCDRALVEGRLLAVLAQRGGAP